MSNLEKNKKDLNDINAFLDQRVDLLLKVENWEICVNNFADSYKTLLLEIVEYFENHNEYSISIKSSIDLQLLEIVKELKRKIDLLVNYWENGFYKPNK